MIHKSSVIDAKARIGNDVKIALASGSGYPGARRANVNWT